MKKVRRILAVIGLVLIAALYIVTIILAFSKSPDSKNWLMAAIFCTIALPVIIYGIQLVARVVEKLSRREDPGDQDSFRE